LFDHFYSIPQLHKVVISISGNMCTDTQKTIKIVLF